MKKLLKIFSDLFRKISAKAGNQIKMWIREGDAMKWNQHTEIGLQMVPKSEAKSSTLVGYQRAAIATLPSTSMYPQQ